MQNTLPSRILLVDDDASFRRALTEVLAVHGYEVVSCAGAQEAVDLIGRQSVDLVIADVATAAPRPRELLERVGRTHPEVPVIATTAFGSVEDALALTRAGAADYLPKPFRTQTLLDSVGRVLEATRLQREQARVRREMGTHFDGIVGTSPAMLRLFAQIARVAGSPAPVFIHGETGTGKELVARAVHAASGRGAFVPLNCGAIPDHLLESELFGHVRGAFTGADRDKVGLLESADGGTLFLDELGELPLLLQPKLLRALETGEVRRVGETTTRRVDVRVVAATHRDLAAAVAAGTFREDLYWRLNVLRLEIPPLRERPGDVQLLVEDFLRRFAERSTGRRLSVSPEAMHLLQAAPWTGNVRQLLNTLERVAAFCDGPEVGVEDLPGELRQGETRRARPAAPAAAAHEMTLARLERQHILDVLRRAGGNRTRAAEVLGIPRRTLYRRLQEYGVLPRPALAG